MADSSAQRKVRRAARVALDKKALDLTVLDVQHVATLLGYQALIAETRGDTEEVRPVLPMDPHGLVDQAKIQLIDELGGLQSLAGMPPAQVHPRERVEAAPIP